MIVQETVAINNKEFVKTYSDTGYYIEREGVKYAEAVDLMESNRTYTETDELIDSEGNANSEGALTEEDKEYAEAGKILLGVSE